MNENKIIANKDTLLALLQGMLIGYALNVFISTLLGSLIGIRWMFGNIKDFGAIFRFSWEFLGFYGMCIGGIIGLALKGEAFDKDFKFNLYFLAIFSCPSVLLIIFSHFIDGLMNSDEALASIYAAMVFVNIISLYLFMKSKGVKKDLYNAVGNALTVLAVIFALCFGLFIERKMNIDPQAYFYISIFVSFLFSILAYFMKIYHSKHINLKQSS